MKELIALPFLGLALIVQTVVFSRTPLLSGYADLMLVVLAAWSLQKYVNSSWHWALLGGAMVGYVSGLPWIVPVVSYVVVVALGRFLVHRVWQAPLLAIFAVVFLGTLLMHLFSIVVLRLLGTEMSVGNALGLVTLPSLLVNLAVAIPVYPLMRDLARWLYAVEDEE
ncbi:MAG: hypothetical protein L3J16_03160 [Anaerolineales bacterium]|nr:hypothetical protein [Anaerolineales bacterium]